jgi:hypothetical protein
MFYSLIFARPILTRKIPISQQSQRSGPQAVSSETKPAGAFQGPKPQPPLSSHANLLSQPAASLSRREMYHQTLLGCLGTSMEPPTASSHSHRATLSTLKDSFANQTPPKWPPQATLIAPASRTSNRRLGKLSRPPESKTPHARSCTISIWSLFELHEAPRWRRSNRRV